MATKSLSLTAHPLYSNLLSAWTAIATTFYLSTLGSFLLVISTSISAMAEDSVKITDTVPPPPPVAPNNRLVKYKYNTIIPIDTEPPTYTSRNQTKEYTFSAPEAETETKESNEVFGYKVQVFGTGDELLEQVQDIEPSAFQQDEIIQVGIFSDRDNAEDLVRKLAMNGLWARVINNEQ
ncbi:MAG: hypothetical protein Tsb0014_26410 [Pleurocapsa sp.]